MTSSTNGCSDTVVLPSTVFSVYSATGLGCWYLEHWGIYDNTATAGGAQTGWWHWKRNNQQTDNVLL